MVLTFLSLPKTVEISCERGSSSRIPCNAKFTPMLKAAKRPKANERNQTRDI